MEFLFWFLPISFFSFVYDAQWFIYHHLFMTHHYLFIIIYLWRIIIKVSVFFGSVPCPDSHIQIPRFLIFQPSKNRHFLRIWTSLIRLRWSIRSRYTSCLRWHFLGTHAYEIKNIDCLLTPEFVLVPIEYFESIALLRCNTIETYDRKYKTVIEGVFVSAFSNIRFSLSSLISI